MGEGATDRAGYLAALACYRSRAVASAVGPRLRDVFSVCDVDEGPLDLANARALVKQLGRAGGAAAEFFAGLADGVEKRRLIAFSLNFRG